VCKVYNGQGVFLYRDLSMHPSVEANYLARPIFLDVVKRAMTTSRPSWFGIKGVDAAP